MVNLREVLVDWEVDNGRAAVSVFHFDTLVEVDDMRAALNLRLTGLNAVLANATGWTIRNDGKIFESTTGTLTGQWTEPTLYQGAGTGGAQVVPNASQMLIRKLTGTIVAGRFLQGRVFIPGVAANFVDLGEIANETVDFVLDTWTPEAAAASGEVVWSRPLGARAGTSATVQGYSVWKELAVQRKRR